MRVLASALRGDVRHGTLQKLQSACCTPSPETSRVMEVFLALAGNLIYLINVDYAALGALHIKIRRLKELEDDVFHVLADITGFGERGGVGNGERHVEHLRKRLGEERFAAAGGTYEQYVALLQLNIRLAGPWRMRL